MSASRAARPRLLAAAGALAILVAGCGGEGGDGSIPQDTGDEMVAMVEEIRTATDEQDCDTAQTVTTDLRNEADTLEGGETKTALIEMIENLDRNLDEECTERGTSDEEVDPKPEEEEETTPIAPTTTTTAVPTTTTTTPVPEEEEEPETPEQPPGEGQGPPATPPGQSGGSGAPDGGIGAEERGKKPKKPKKEKG
jgi:hypothetical protein